MKQRWLRFNHDSLGNHTANSSVDGSRNHRKRCHLGRVRIPSPIRLDTSRSIERFGMAMCEECESYSAVLQHGDRYLCLECAIDLKGLK